MTVAELAKEAAWFGGSIAGHAEINVAQGGPGFGTHVVDVEVDRLLEALGGHVEVVAGSKLLVRTDKDEEVEVESAGRDAAGVDPLGGDGRVGAARQPRGLGCELGSGRVGSSLRTVCPPGHPSSAAAASARRGIACQSAIRHPSNGQYSWR